MECLNKLVGYESACVETGAIYLLNQLPSISINMGANIANSDRQTAKAVFRNAIDLAARQVSALVVQNLNGVIVPSVLDNEFLCRPPQTLQEITWTNPLDNSGQIGVRLLFDERSELQDAYIRKLRVLVKNAGTFVMTITEQDGTFTSNSYTFLASPNFNEIQLDYKCKTKVVIVSFDKSSGVVLGGFKCYETTKKGCGCGGGGSSANPQDNKIARMYGYNSTNSSSFGDTIFGIQPQIQIECNSDKLVCMYANSLAQAVLYLAGVNLIQESLTSDRINYTTLNSLEDKRELSKQWTSFANQIIKKIGYDIQFASSNIKDACIVCQGISSSELVR